jgi:DNA-binding CsgD family transcriptional regulator
MRNITKIEVFPHAAELGVGIRICDRTAREKHCGIFHERAPDMAKSKAKKTTFNNSFNLDPAMAHAMVERLTPRERQTAERIAMGTPQEEIARDLGISPKTLDIFRGKVKKKFRTTTHGIGRIWFCAMSSPAPADGKRPAKK